jgi:hypothetical protein
VSDIDFISQTKNHSFWLMAGDDIICPIIVTGYVEGCVLMEMVIGVLFEPDSQAEFRMR